MNIDKIKRQISENPFHMILGVILIIFGIYLLFSMSYFSWPPQAVRLINSILGTAAIYDGAGIIYVAFQRHFPVKADRIWLLATSAFLGFETALEIAHVFMGLGKHTGGFIIIIAGYLLLTFALAKKH